MDDQVQFQSAILADPLRKKSQVRVSQFNENILKQQQSSYLPIRESVSKMNCTLSQLVNVLEQTFKYMQIINNQDVVLCLGYTGSGKSTLFSYLVFGPTGVKEDIITYFIGPNQNKEKKRKVVSNSTANTVFKIGHSEYESETFLPTFWKDERSDLLFCDIAGFGDSGPPLIQLINIFTLQYLINNARSVRVILLITLMQLQEQRGKLVSKLIMEALNLFESDNDRISQYTSIFLPLISSKKIPKSVNFDIDKVRSDLKEIIDKHIFDRVHDPSELSKQPSFIELLQSQTVIDTNNSFQSINDGQNNGLNQSQLQNSFSAKFSNQLMLFDPLEKAFIQADTGKDQTVKYEQLIKAIQNLKGYQKPSLQNSSLSNSKEVKHISMNYDMELKLNGMFIEMEKQINIIKNKHEQYVRENSVLMRPIFSQDPELLQILKNYEFFYMHNFLSSQQINKKNQLYYTINEIEISLENILFFQNQKGYVQNEFESLLDNLITSNYIEIVPKLIMFFKLIERLKQEIKLQKQVSEISSASKDQETSERQTQKIDNLFADQFQQLIWVAESYLQVILDRIVQNGDDLHKFAYHLRKADIETDLYSKVFLVGRIKPILLEIYLSNQWYFPQGKDKLQLNDVQFGQMTQKQSVNFSLHLASQEQVMSLQFLDQQSDQPVKAKSQNNQNDRFIFVLEEDGFMIVPVLLNQLMQCDSKQSDTNKVLAPNLDTFDNNNNDLMIKDKTNQYLTSSKLSTKSQKNKIAEKQTHNIWILQASDSDFEAPFYIELPQPSRQNSRIQVVLKKYLFMPNSDTFGNAQGNHLTQNYQVIVSRKYTVSEKHKKCALWDIVKHEQFDNNQEPEFAETIQQQLYTNETPFNFSVRIVDHSEIKLFEKLKSCTIALERQIPKHDLNSQFQFKLRTRLSFLLQAIFDETQIRFEKPSQLFMNYLKKGFNFNQIREIFFDRFGQIQKNHRLANRSSLDTLHELISYYIMALGDQVEADTVGLADVDNFINSSFYIWCNLHEIQPYMITEVQIEFDQVSTGQIKEQQFSFAVSNFLQQVDKLIQPKVFLKDLLNQESLKKTYQRQKHSVKRYRRKVTVDAKDLKDGNLFHQPVLWIQLLKQQLSKFQIQNDAVQIKQISKKQTKSIFRTKQIKVEEQTYKTSNLNILRKYLHTHLLNFGLQKDTIQEIIFSEEFMLKPHEAKQLNIYMNAMLYFQDLQQAKIDLDGSQNKEMNGTFDFIDTNYEFIRTQEIDEEESFIDFVFYDKDSQWVQDQHQISPKTLQIEPKEVQNRSERWINSLQYYLENLDKELCLKTYKNNEANWKQIIGKKKQQVSSMVQYQPFSKADIKRLTFGTDSMFGFFNNKNQKISSKKHLEALNCLLKSFALRMEMKTLEQVECFKDLALIIYQMVGVDCQTEQDTDILDLSVDEINRTTFKLDQFDHVNNLEIAFKLLVKISNLKHFISLQQGQNDLIYKIALFEFDCLFASHLPALHKHFQLIGFKWTNSFGTQWYQHLLLSFIAQSFDSKDIQISQSCILEVWDEIIECCGKCQSIPWVLIHQLILYILALHQWHLLQINDTDQVHEFLVVANKIVLAANSSELDKIEEYYLSINSQHSQLNQLNKYPPYWLRIDQQDINQNKANLDNFHQKGNSELTKDNKDIVKNHKEILHIKERLNRRFETDRLGLSLNMGVQLCQFRKHLLKMDIALKKNSSKFSKLFQRQKIKLQNNQDVLENAGSEDEEVFDTIFSRENDQPILKSEENLDKGQSDKFRQARQGCLNILNQLY